MRYIISFVFFVGIAACVGKAMSPPLQPIMPLAFDEMHDPEAQQAEFYDFMWQSFIAVNWPADPDGRRGQPDMDSSILDMTGSGDLPLTVWETYKEPSEVFTKPEYWAEAAEWNSPRFRPGSNTGARHLLGYLEGLTEYATDYNQPYFFDEKTGPLIDQNGGYVRYEVAFNEAFFTYIRHFGYYNADEQARAVQAYLAGDRSESAFQRPPHGNPAELGRGGYLHALPEYARQGLVDVKAAWRVLDPAKGDRLERYLHRNIIVDDYGTEETMGLVALHILRWTPNGYDPETGKQGGYVASTFEHVDNVRADFEPYPGLKPSFNDGLPPSLEQAEYGFEGDIPTHAMELVPEPVDIYRVTPLPPAVKAVNQKYQSELLNSGSEKSVFAYYELIGTQNPHPGNTFKFDTVAERNLNGHQGPTTGKYSNTNNLINAALESYTQKNFSCILCHSRARPIGVPEKAWEEDHFKVLTFLLQSAHHEVEPDSASSEAEVQ